MTIELERLAPEHRPLLGSFVCSKPTGEELVRFLNEEALPEQAANVSTTLVALNERADRIDAFVTLSATAYPAGAELREALGISVPFVPAVILQFIGVHDDRLGDHLGLQIFEWARYEALSLNYFVGVRWMRLEVRVANWKAYQLYCSPAWSFRPLWLRAGRDDEMEPAIPPPDPTLPNPPAGLRGSRLIPMYYDLVQELGPYLPDVEAGS